MWKTNTHLQLRGVRSLDGVEVLVVALQRRLRSGQVGARRIVLRAAKQAAVHIKRAIFAHRSECSTSHERRAASRQHELSHAHTVSGDETAQRGGERHDSSETKLRTHGITEACKSPSCRAVCLSCACEAKSSDRRPRERFRTTTNSSRQSQGNATALHRNSRR